MAFKLAHILSTSGLQPAPLVPWPVRPELIVKDGTDSQASGLDGGEPDGMAAQTARRTRAGQFKIADALTLDRLSEVALSGSLDQVLISPDAALSHLPVTDLTSDDARRVGQGIDLQIEEASASPWANGQAVRLRNTDGRLIAVGIYDEGRRTVHPQVVIVNT